IFPVVVLVNFFVQTLRGRVTEILLPRRLNCDMSPRPNFKHPLLRFYRPFNAFAFDTQVPTSARNVGPYQSHPHTFCMTLCVVVKALLSGRMLRVVPLLSRHPTPP